MAHFSVLWPQVKGFTWKHYRLRRQLYSRMPLIGGWLRRRAARALERDGSPGAVWTLAEALARSDDERVRAIALDSIHNIDTEPQIDALCAAWAETRHPDLTALLTERGWVASAPEDVRVLSALKTKQLELLTGSASVMEPLAQACEDADREIAGRARLALRQLEEKAKEALCRLLIEHYYPIAQEIALAAGYVPRDEYQRALFFFVTEQWERYEALDFDRRLLRTAYDTADAALRQRVMEKLRKAGRTDFLVVVAGGDYRSRAAEMTPREADFLVQMLAANGEWAKLWPLVFDLPLIWSMRAVKILAQNGWKPGAEDERATFEELASLAPAEMLEAGKDVPSAILRARARVPGRINEVAFSPVRPVIAIGTGQQKVGLWNFQHGAMETVLRGFDHSIGQVIFTPNGTLLCGERTNSLAPCAIHGWRDGQGFRLGQHDASVTAVEAAGSSLALTAGRDHSVILWDLVARSKVREVAFGDWARAARASPDRRQAVLLYRGARLVSLPQLEVLATGGGGSMSRCVAFAPGGEALIVGKNNGEVVVYNRKRRRLNRERRTFAHHSGQVQGVEVLPNSSVVVTAGSDGLVQFISWENRAVLGSVRVPGERLTSLKISPDGAFMAVGDSDASMSLWDLRARDLFTHPLALASPVHLSVAHTLADDASLNPPIRQALKFVACVLRHRFRYEIEIGEAPTIKVGEFDIEIE
jgi:HEAT repeat protein